MKEINELLRHAPLLFIYLFKSECLFPVLDRSLQSDIACFAEPRHAGHKCKSVAWTPRGEKWPCIHSFASMYLLSLLDLILSEFSSKDSWVYVAAAVAVTLQVQFGIAESSVN